jgi:predicted  nucleic acid-binding Zn-ribbon protein
MKHFHDVLRAIYELDHKLQQDLNQTRQQLQKLQSDKRALEDKNTKRAFQERLGSSYRKADLQQRLAQERKTTRNTETALSSLQERLFQPQSDFETSHARVDERIARLKEKLEKERSKTSAKTKPTANEARTAYDRSVLSF